MGALVDGHGHARAQKRFVLWSSFAAVSLHALLLAIEYSPSLITKPNAEQEISVQLVQDQPEAEKEISDDIKVAGATREPEADLASPEPVQNTIETPLPPVLVKQPNPDQNQTAAISINSDAFKSFVEQETQRAINQGSKEAGAFEQSFIAPTEPVKQEFSRGTAALGGGIYKVSRNGQTCQTLVMVPQSFDDFNNGTISTSGECEPNKKAFNLTNEDGSIRNSDRYD